MSFLFGGAPPTTAELAARYKRHITRSIRELDREALKLSNEEKVLMNEVKKASVNNMKLSMQKAKAVVRTRRTLNKFSNMKAHLQGIGSRIQNIKSMEALQKSIQSAVCMMQGFNKVTGGAHLLSALNDMEKQNGYMTLQSEMTDERLDEIFEEDKDEEDTSEVVIQIMTEAGVQLPASVFETHPELELSLEERLELVRSSVANR